MKLIHVFVLINFFFAVSIDAMDKEYSTIIVKSQRDSTLILNQYFSSDICMEKPTHDNALDKRVITKRKRPLADEGTLSSKKRQKVSPNTALERREALRKAIFKGEHYTYEQLTGEYKVTKCTIVNDLEVLVRNGEVSRDQENSFVESVYNYRDKEEVIAAVRQQMPVKKLISKFQLGDEKSLKEYLNKKCKELTEAEISYLRNVKGPKKGRGVTKKEVADFMINCYESNRVPSTFVELHKGYNKKKKKEADKKKKQKDTLSLTAFKRHVWDILERKMLEDAQIRDAYKHLKLYQ